MRRAFAAVLASGILIAIGGCGHDLTGSGASAVPIIPAGINHSSASGGGVTISMPDTLLANSVGRCDLPLTINSTVTGSLGSSTVTTNSTPHSVSSTTMQSVMSSIHTGQQSGTLFDYQISGQNAQAPYTGSWMVTWIVGGTAYSGTLNFVCSGSLPQVTRPCYENGSPDTREILYKIAYTAVVTNCYGQTSTETVYEFRSTDGYYARPSSIDFYSYNAGDLAEAYWHPAS